MDKSKIVKGVGGLIVSTGVSAVVANLVKATTPVNTNKYVNICIHVGSWCVAGMAAAKASAEFSETVDSVVNVVKSFRQKETVTLEVVEGGGE